MNFALNELEYSISNVQYYYFKYILYSVFFNDIYTSMLSSSYYAGNKIPLKISDFT